MDTWSANPFLEITRRGADETIVYEPVFDNYYRFPAREFRLLTRAAQPNGLSQSDPGADPLQQLADEHLVLPRQRAQPGPSRALLEQVRCVSRRLGARFRAQLAPALAGPGGATGKLEAVRQLPFGEALLYLAETKIALGGRERARFHLLNTYLPLVDPVGLFERCRGLVDRLWSPWTVRLLLALNLLALPAYILHFRSLLRSTAGYYAQRTPGRWLLTLALFILQGALHELGHGLALARYGQAPREAGIVLMLLLPGVYIDTSAAYLLPDRRQRIAVSFAGILVNDLCLLLGLLAYLVLPAGLARDAIGAFVIGNTLFSVLAYAPFLKTDTYFILSDCLDVPNLRQTSVRVLKDLLAGRRVERAWKHLLAAYAALSYLYYAVAAVMSAGSLYLLLRRLGGLLSGAIRLLGV